jgi:hypothetical protein
MRTEIELCFWSGQAHEDVPRGGLHARKYIHLAGVVGGAVGGIRPRARERERERREKIQNLNTSTYELFFTSIFLHIFFETNFGGAPIY